MNAAELFGIGGAWSRALGTDSPLDRKPAVADSPISAASLKISTRESNAAEIAAAQERLRTASGALRSAFGAFARETQPVFTTVSQSRDAAAASTSGRARAAAATVNYHALGATVGANTQTTTVRSSASTLGLDIASAELASRLVSSAGLGLDVTTAESASTIASTAEMNTGFTTSYGSSTLNFANGAQTSSSVGALTGTYTGTGAAASATSLTLEITKGGTLGGGLIGMGTADIDFRVKDQAGTVLFTYSGTLSKNEGVYLGASIGLTVAFSAGTLTANHTSSTTVSHNPITVSTTAAFNASAALRPKFDSGATVSAGSFTVNGTSITVAANDSIDSVVGKINGAGAGVTAAVSGDRITLTSTGISEDAIVLANDTTGFLAATKLAAATTTLGNIRDDQQVLAKTSQFSGVASGSFTINGVSISVDRNADTLTTLLTKINNAGAGVTATFNTGTSTIELTGTTLSEDLITVANDTTGFLTAAGLSTNNTVRGNIRDDEQVLAKTSQFGGVTTGAFSVNGVSIAVNADTDTLASVIGRVNASGAGVTASYDSAADRLVFTPDVAGATLTLGDDTSGLLAAASVATGTIGSRVNTAAAFNASDADGPLFDPGVTVQAGSFTVNGVTIDVDADDSVASVLAKITASAAGVTAAYDADTQTVTLTANDYDTSPIALGADTSGFLAAVKLDGTAAASAAVGSMSAYGTRLSSMAEYAGVATGTLTVNGQDVAIDPASTTVQGLVDALNGIADVSASVDETTGRILISSTVKGGTVTLADTSGLLATLGITAGIHYGAQASSGTVATQSGTTVMNNAAAVASSGGSAVTGLNDMLAELMKGREGDADFQRALKNALTTAVETLRDAGVRGMSVTGDGDDLAVSFSRDDVVSALDGLGDHVDLDAALGSLLERFEQEVATAAGWDSPTTPTTHTLDLEEMSRARLAADRAATSLLLFKSSLQTKEPDAQTAMKAYGNQR